MKENTMVRIDLELKQKAQNNNINLSATLEEALIIKLGLIDGSANEIEVITLKNELEKEQQIIHEKALNVQNLIQKLKKYEQDLELQTQEKLKKQKELIENANKCLICLKVLSDTEKIITAKKGKICNYCYHSADTLKLKEALK